MNKAAIKNYAVAARKKWIQAIAQQAAFYGCTENSLLGNEEIEKRLADKGVFLTDSEKSARTRLVDDIRTKGYHNTIEEIAYTWFNRLIAIRFMEVNKYLPSGIRVLSSEDSERIEPDCIREYARLDFLNQETAAKCAAESDEKLYRYILIEQCSALGKIMPKMFTHVADYAAMLLPERLYIKDGLVYDLTHAISEEDFGEQVEIIGWLYQYYISEKKDEVFAALKKNVKITRENIPAATQLFTPDWIVKYMVENSLGRLWLEHCPPSMAHGNGLRELWVYYIDEAGQEPEVEQKLKELRGSYTLENPTQIKLIDPCMGSGHILVYAFDVLYQIYVGQGYSERDIPDLILENNIYGLDIDERACQLAYFALMMKARSYNRRFFRREDVPQPQVYSPRAAAELLEYGSLYKADILDPMPEQTFGQLELDDIKYADKLNDWSFRRLLHQKYDVVVTNPPYMGSSGMGAELAEYVKKNYPDSKSDTSTVFMEKSLGLCKSMGLMSMINIPVWMFLSSFDALRRKFLSNNTIINMTHFGRGVFGSDFGTTSFVFSRSNIENYKAIYRKLYKKQGAVDSLEQKEKWFFSDMGFYIFSQADYYKIPGSPIAYWATEPYLKAYRDGTLLDMLAPPKQGSTTGNNDLFLRFWYEVKTNYNKWYPCLKGGAYRKWYGNHEYVIDWENDGENIKHEGRQTIRNPLFLFKKGISWSRVTISQPSFRIMRDGFFFESASGVCFPKSNDEYILGLLNSRISQCIAEMLNPTATLQSGDLGRIPVLESRNYIDNVNEVVVSSIDLSKNDWDSFETSWDFRTHPLLGGEQTVEAAYNKWERECQIRFNILKANEEELNRIFIDIYGLQDELTPEVEDKDVTVRKADLGRDIRSFVSYAVGCMFGRYSPDVPGLAYAGGGWDGSKYSSYIPEDDNILPITDADYFEDDIVMRFVDFVKVAYGEDTLAENLEFIARALYPNGNGTAREMIRRYFQSDFFKDHCKIYQKRPIYWLFDSGKQNGFKALIYLHRYDKYTVARVRTEYLHPLQHKYEAEIERMNKLSDLPETSARDKAEFRKQTEKIAKQIAECRAYDQVISHIAAQTIELDLDDGVKVNYEKFQGVEVPRDDGKGAVKMDLLGKI